MVPGIRKTAAASDTFALYDTALPAFELAIAQFRTDCEFGTRFCRSRGSFPGRAPRSRGASHAARRDRIDRGVAAFDHDQQQ